MAQKQAFIALLNDFFEESNKKQIILKSAVCFDKMKSFFKTNEATIIKKLGFVYHFQIAPSQGKQPIIWTVDLKRGSEAIQDGKQGEADATFILVDKDAFSLFKGKLNPKKAFIQDKMKIKGSISAAFYFWQNVIPFPKL